MGIAISDKALTETVLTSIRSAYRDMPNPHFRRESIITSSNHFSKIAARFCANVPAFIPRSVFAPIAELLEGPALRGRGSRIFQKYICLSIDLPKISLKSRRFCTYGLSPVDIATFLVFYCRSWELWIFSYPTCAYGEFLPINYMGAVFVSQIPAPTIWRLSLYDLTAG